MRALWISVCVTLVIAFVEAQRNIYVPKPTVSLDKRPRLPTWRRPPEERRKLSIFPKNNMKFVVTQRTPLKNESTTPSIPTKRPLMRKFIVKDKSERDTVIYTPRKPLMEPKRFNVLTTLNPKRDSIRNFKAKKDEVTAEESTIKTAVTSFRTENTFKLNKGNLIQVLNSINKATVNSTKFNEQPDKAPNKHDTKVDQNNDAVEVTSPDEAVDKSVTGNSVNNKKEIITVTKVKEQVDKTTEQVFLSKQEHKVIPNNTSSNANTQDDGSEEYEYEENYYDGIEANTTAANIKEQVSASTEKVFISKQINSVSQNNESLKINLLDNESDKSLINESNSKVSVVTSTQISNKEEIESTTHVLTKEPVIFNEPFEGRSLDLNDTEINSQSDQLFLNSSNKHSSEKPDDPSKLNDLKILMKAIEKDTWSDSDNRSSLFLNEVEPVLVKEQDNNDETVKIQLKDFGKIPDDNEKVKQVNNIRFDKTTNTTENNDNENVTEALDKKETPNTEAKAGLMNTEIIKNNISVDIINNYKDVIEVTTSQSISELNENTQLLKLDLNIVEEYADKPGTISSEYDKTTLGSDTYDSLTESPIEITFDNLRKPLPEEISNEPSIIEPIVINKSFNDRGNEIFEINDNGDTNTFRKIDNFNIEQKDSDEKSIIFGYFHNLPKVIKDKSTVADNSEVAVEKKPLENLDTNIVEEYSDEPNINTTEVEGSIQESFLNVSRTESPIEIIFDSQKALVTEKMLFKTTFNVTGQKLISTVDNPEMNDSLEVEDENVNIICAIENLSNEHHETEHNASGAIKNSLTNLDVIVNYDSNIHDKSAFAGTQLINKHINIVDEDTVKPDTVTIVIDRTISTNETYIEGAHAHDNPIEILYFDHEPLNVDEFNTKNNTKASVADSDVTTYGTALLNHDMSIARDDSIKHDSITVVVDEPFDTQKPSGGHVTDAPLTIPFNNPEPPSTNGLELEKFDLMKNIISELNIPVTKVAQKVEDGDTDTIIEKITAEQNADDKIDSPSFADIINNKANVDDNNKVTTSEAQLVNLHINISEGNSDKPKTITIVFDGTTQKTFLNGEHINDGPIGILFDNLEPLGPNKLLPSRSLHEKMNESVIEQTSSSDDVISYDATTNRPVLTDEDISDELIFISSIPSDESTSNESKSKGEGLLNVSNKASENTSIESIVDNSINTSDDISIESPVIGSASILSNEDMSESEEMIAEADLSKKFSDEISKESQIINDSFSSMVKNEDISDEKLTEKSENLTDEISNESHVLNESSTNVTTNEEISDENMTDKSENLTDEISDESRIANESSSSLLTNEEISENLTDEISNESHVLNESLTNVITNEEISNENMTDKSENLTDEISDESRIANESSSSLVTNEEISHEIIGDKSESFAKEIWNESPVTVTETSSIDLTAEGLFDVSVEPKNETNEDASTEPAIDIRRPSIELASDEILINRRKRSINVIEEENMATTLSGFKYTGHETRLGNDLSFKNINA